VTGAETGFLVDRAEHLDDASVAQVRALASAAADADGAEPLSEAVLLGLGPATTTAAVHLLVRDAGGALAGYAYLDLDGGGPGRSVVELVVGPASRRRGLGRALATAATVAAEESGGQLLAWAHGDHPSAAALALDLGYEPVRQLWQLRRALLTIPAEPALPAGMSLRPFEPGRDEAGWLALNRLAFADHPEQGRWTTDDLRLRLAEPWFDPAGFLLAVEDATGRLVGFHWTKVHDRPAVDGPVADRPARRPIGEVYVLGVDPAVHGLGVGRALTDAGLRHLAGRGLDRVMLYVDAANTAALALYRRLGFARWATHVQYGRSPQQR
jgi:mycothiol synthase